MMNLSIKLLGHYFIIGIRGDQEVLRRKCVAVFIDRESIVQDVDLVPRDRSVVRAGSHY